MRQLWYIHKQCACMKEAQTVHLSLTRLWCNLNTPLFVPYTLTYHWLPGFRFLKFLGVTGLSFVVETSTNIIGSWPSADSDEEDYKQTTQDVEKRKDSPLKLPANSPSPAEHSPTLGKL